MDIRRDLLGVIGLLFLEVSALIFYENNIPCRDSGDFWMFLAGQSMVVGTIIVRWVSKYPDPIMATRWHIVINGLPLVILSFLNHDSALNGSLKELTTTDICALVILLFLKALSVMKHTSIMQQKAA